MRAALGAGSSGRRILLLAVAGFLSVSALLAVGILLFGDFGETEGHILATTALLAGYGLLALPAAILFDQRRLRALTIAVAALAAVAAPLALGTVWSGEPPESLGDSTLTVTFALGAAAQSSALAARRRDRDPRSVRFLFAGSVGLASVAAAMLTWLVWAGGDSPAYGRGLGALAVLDVLAVALQPILARAQAEPSRMRLRIRVESGETVDLSLEAPDFAAAAAKAIRTIERDGRRVLSLEAVDRAGTPPVVPADDPAHARLCESADPRLE